MICERGGCRAVVTTEAPDADDVATVGEVGSRSSRLARGQDCWGIFRHRHHFLGRPRLFLSSAVTTGGILGCITGVLLAVG